MDKRCQQSHHPPEAERKRLAYLRLRAGDGKKLEARVRRRLFVVLLCTAPKSSEKLVMREVEVRRRPRPEASGVARG